MKILDIYIFIYKSELSYNSINFTISYRRPNYTLLYNLLISFMKKLLESKKLRLKDKYNHVKINRIMTVINWR